MKKTRSTVVLLLSLLIFAFSSCGEKKSPSAIEDSTCLNYGVVFDYQGLKYRIINANSVSIVAINDDESSNKEVIILPTVEYQDTKYHVAKIEHKALWTMNINSIVLANSIPSGQNESSNSKNRNNGFYKSPDLQMHHLYGDVISATIYNYHDGESEGYEDGNGAVRFKANGYLSQQYYTKMYRNSKGQLVRAQHEYDVLYDEEGTIWEYDENGNVIYAKRSVPDDSFETRYAYNLENELVGMVHSYWSEGEGYAIDLFSNIQYDEHHNWVERDVYRVGLSGGWEYKNQEIYAYHQVRKIEYR